jgi:hypothetical protein
MFNRNSTTPEIIKQAAERKKIQPRRGVLRIVSEPVGNSEVTLGKFLAKIQIDVEKSSCHRQSRNDIGISLEM